MPKIFAMFAFSLAGASAAPALDTAPPPFAPNASVAFVVANDDNETSTQRTKGGRPAPAFKSVSGNQQRLRKASKYEADEGFCECSDERVRAHCLIYMKLRGDRS